MNNQNFRFFPWNYLIKNPKINKYLLKTAILFKDI